MRVPAVCQHQLAVTEHPISVTKLYMGTSMHGNYKHIHTCTHKHTLACTHTPQTQLIELRTTNYQLKEEQQRLVSGE